MKPVEQVGTEVLRQETLEVYRELSGALTAYACRLTSDMDLAQDAIQETFLRFFLVAKFDDRHFRLLKGG